MIKQSHVIIPYANRFAEMFNTTRVEARRAFPQAIAMIKTLALLHQRQRKADAEGRIIATKDDYEVAQHLLKGPLSRSIGGGLSDPAMRFYERLVGFVSSDGEFTSSDVKGKESSSDRSVKNWINEMAEVGISELTQEHRGSRPVGESTRGESETIKMVVDIGKIFGHEATEVTPANGPSQLSASKREVATTAPSRQVVVADDSTPDPWESPNAIPIDRIAPCSKCASLKMWMSSAGDLRGLAPGEWRCLHCDPPTKARELLKLAGRLRGRRAVR